MDRSKLRITGTVSSIPFVTDEEGVTQNDVYTVDGPVRVTRFSTSTLSGVNYSATLFAYHSLVARMETMIIPGAPAEVVHQRTSMDWNAQASGMTG